MRISFKRNGFIALASMLSFAVYAGDNLPLATAASGTNGSFQVSEYGVDTSNEIQQARVIQGTVLEEGTNEPLIGVNVVVKGTTIGTTTDVEGKYSIRIPSDNAILVFSYIGQKTEEYSVKGLRTLDVIMKSDATMLSEVVVYTGYMTQKKADLTGSVALADSKDIKKTSANVMKAMQGKMAGVKISNNGGNPAEDIGIQIRGLSSLSGAVTPLIVLDGMPAEGLNLRDINSGDIESIQVLKDAASASIYGARASGGVILVQTKKGKAGKTTIDYNGSVSVSSIINRPEMMNATEWGTAAFRAAAYDEWAYGSGLLLPNGFEYEYHRGDNGMLVLDNMKMKEYLDNNQLVKATDTNWMDEIFRTAVSTNHQLTISNGSDKAKSLFSLGYTNNQLALPYLGGVDRDDAIYANTRRFVWSEYNPYFFKGSYFEGIGGHHIGTDMIWPMSLIMKALTAQDDEELQQCIQMLQKTHAGTGFMHESFHKDDPKRFTRSWFAWANTLFGELLWKTFNEKPYLLEY
jgi:TonB-dependent SusC/RagA subfamily outer membrane receptor